MRNVASDLEGLLFSTEDLNEDECILKTGFKKETLLLLLSVCVYLWQTPIIHHCIELLIHQLSDEVLDFVLLQVS